MTFAVWLTGGLLMSAIGATLGYLEGRDEGSDRRRALYRELRSRRDAEDQKDRAETLVKYWQAEVLRLRAEVRDLQDRHNEGPYR